MRRFTEEETERIAELLCAGGCLAVPMDTVYGLCAAIGEETKEKLYVIKDRPKSKAFPILCKDLAQLKQIAYTDARSDAVISALMPGPLTVILRRREDVLPREGETLAIRLADGVMKQVLHHLGSPVYLTSANRSGSPECRTAGEIEQQCPGVDGILEGTPGYGQASTIVDLTQKEIRILRQGPVGIEEICRAAEEKGTGL